MSRFLLSIYSLLVTASVVFSQTLRINEVMASNVNTILDEDGASSDWLEIHNAGAVPIDLDGYALSDDASFENPWIFPSFTLNPNQYLLVFASDKDRVEVPRFWRTVIDAGEEWKYIVPNNEVPPNWKMVDFDDTDWLSGKTSIGYGDGDDSTIVDEGTISVFLRKTFEVASRDKITDCLLHVDYDDGFVSYLNGTEIARSGLEGDQPAFDATASGHDAVMFSGGFPEEFNISEIQTLLREGENVLAVQVHNASASSSDMSIIPILSFGSSEKSEGQQSQFLSIKSNYFHTNFKISSSVDSIFLRSPSLEIIDRLNIKEIATDISIGLASDGSDELLFFDQPTPGSVNSPSGYSTTIPSGEVIFSKAGGLYSGLLQIEMSSSQESDSHIYYTLDGSVPKLSSTKYISAIEISQSAVLKARVINGVSLPGKITTASYLIDVNHDLPIISISADPYDFFDETNGMYMLGPNAESETPYFGANFWLDWERPVHVEMFEENGDLAFSANAGAKIFGGWSRGWDQKSLSIFFRDSYGDGPINYQLFPEKELFEFSSIVLRNSGNDWLRTMLRDGLLTTLFNESVDTQGFRPSVVYINGEYWGIHNIREKVNEHFIANNHKIDSDSITILEYGGNPVLGSSEHYYALLDFVKARDLSLEGNYEYVQTQMDVSNYLYYMSANIFINNYDWPASNIKFWRESTNTGRWRWIAYDKDAGFGIWNGQTYSENRIGIIMEGGEEWPAPAWSTLLFRKLIKNESARNQFINIYADQLNSTWKTEVIHKEIDIKKANIINEMPRHINRWDDPYSYSDWNQRIRELYTYATERPKYARANLIREFNLSGDFNVNLDVSNPSHGWVRINTIKPDVYPWDGTYFAEVPIEIEALPMPGYRFVRWEGSETTTRSKLKITTADSVNLKAVFEVAGEVVDFLVINEINYNSSAEEDIDDWVEIYNKDASPINLSGWVLKDNDDTHAFEFPEGTTIGGRGYLVLCVDEDNFAFNYPGITNYLGNMDFGLSGSGDCVRLFDADGQLVEEVCYDDEQPWPKEADGGGATLALFDPRLDNTDPANWFAQFEKGNPGRYNGQVLGLLENGPIRQLRIYPNPASEQIQITFEQQHSGKVDLTILDLNGRKIVQLANESFAAGTHDFNWIPAARIASGVYIIRLENQDGVFLKKLVLER